MIHIASLQTHILGSLRTADAFPVVASLPPKNNSFLEGEKRRPEMRLLFACYILGCEGKKVPCFRKIYSILQRNKQSWIICVKLCFLKIYLFFYSSLFDFIYIALNISYLFNPDFFRYAYVHAMRTMCTGSYAPGNQKTRSPKITAKLIITTCIAFS